MVSPGFEEIEQFDATESLRVIQICFLMRNLHL